MIVTIYTLIVRLILFLHRRMFKSRATKKSGTKAVYLAAFRSGLFLRVSFSCRFGRLTIIDESP